MGNVSITILQTSDLHHHASGYGPFLDYNPLIAPQTDSVVGGYSRLATLINTIRQQQAANQIPVLLFDSGDYFMGTVYDMTDADTNYGPAALRFFTQMKYDAVTIGNHEFDYGDSGLAMLLNNGVNNFNKNLGVVGFNVPVVASNITIPPSTPPAPQDPLQSLFDSGVIVTKKIIQLPYGVKIGVLGLIGPTAFSDAPLAGVTVKNDYVPSPGTTTYNPTSYVQTAVNNLINNDGVQVVIALSHGGINNPVSAGAPPTGDDVVLANYVHGINIICSGHYHTLTPKAYVVGPSNTIIFEPGAYGQALSRLDITYNYFLGKIVSYTYTPITVDKTTPGYAKMEGIVQGYQSDLAATLSYLLSSLHFQPASSPMTTPISKTSSTLANLTQPLPPSGTGESALGDLSADALRNVANNFVPAGGSYYDFSVVENGVIRDSIFPGETGTITFADVYDALPLGISPYSSQLLGYPLISFYVTGADLRTICEAGLTIGPSKGSDYYLNFSGLNITYNISDPSLPPLGHVTSVSVYSPADFFCMGYNTKTGTPMPPTPLDDTKYYHGVVDLYALLMMGGIQDILAKYNLEIIPYSDTIGTPLTDYGSNRILLPGGVEFKSWIALLEFLGTAFPYSTIGSDSGYFYNNVVEKQYPRITLQ